MIYRGTGVCANSWRYTVAVFSVSLMLVALLDPGGAVRPKHPDCASDPPPRTWAIGTPAEEAAAARARAAMVKRDLVGRDITAPAVLAAMGAVPRHRFVRPILRDKAYSDRPLPHGCGQTISQPYIVALMTQLAQPMRHHRALDVGTGTGYQAAVLARVVKAVHSIEIVPALAQTAKARLADLEVKNATVHQGDGWAGLAAHGPFDVIIVAAAPAEVPPKLIEQLAPGGRLVIPVGTRRQSLMVLRKPADGGPIERRTVAAVRFVPFTR